MRQLRRLMTQDEWITKSRSVTQRLIRSSAYRQADTLLTFISVQNEPDTGALIKRALSDGKTVGIPKCLDDKEMAFYRIGSACETAPGRFNIPEPADTRAERLIQKTDRTLVILPGLAFDRSGNRLGYGAGYYDRYLSDCPLLCKMMAAFSFQEADEIPCRDGDIQVDWIVTESELIEVR